MRKEEIKEVIAQAKFLPAELQNLILYNIVGSIDIEGFTKFRLEDVERTVNGKNQILSCKLLFKYEHEGVSKMVFVMSFADNALKSLRWTH